MIKIGLGIIVVGNIIGFLVGAGSTVGMVFIALANLGGIVCIIIGIIMWIIGLFAGANSSSYSSSSGPSIGSSMNNWANSRMNDPHTCGNCTQYRSRVCQRDNSPKSAGDSCSNWD